MLFRSDEYRYKLNLLINLNLKIVHEIENTIVLEEEWENNIEDIENLSGDIYHLTTRIKQDENSKSALEEQLGLSDYKEIEKEIEECIRLLREIPELLKYQYQREATEKAGYSQAIKSVETLSGRISIKESLLQIQRDIFSQEFKLNYCDLEDIGDLHKNASSVCCLFS